MAILPISEELRKSQERDKYPVDGFYTDHLMDFENEDAHRGMLQAFQGRDMKAISMYTTAVKTASGRQIGRLDIALDASSKQACGIFRAIVGDDDIASQAEWFDCHDAYQAAMTVWSTLDEMGLFGNLDEIVKRSIAKARLS